ncbi:hypothetical protein L9F63_018118, partial [Diploptera punctata]
GLKKESCEIYNWDYNQLAEMTYQEALYYTSVHNKPNISDCHKWNYIGNGVVSEWDLVCSRKPLKSTVQMAVSLGKFLGALIAGLVADRFLPESPRWLLSQGRREAWKIVNSFQSEHQTKHSIVDPLNPKTETEEENKNEKAVDGRWYRPMLPVIHKLSTLFGHTELRRRLLICYYATCVSSMSYYVLNLNADNFTADRYIYVATAGAVEVLSYIMPLPLLRWTGRRQTLALLYFMSSAALLSILTVPEGKTTTIWIVAMFGRLCVGAVYSLIVIQTSELFPTTNRNTAVSTSSTLAHVGSLAAPFIVDLLGAKAWYIPSTICGCSVLVAGFLVLLLPETKNNELCNTVEEILQTERVSFRNCCSCPS